MMHHHHGVLLLDSPASRLGRRGGSDGAVPDDAVWLNFLSGHHRVGGALSNNYCDEKAGSLHASPLVEQIIPLLANST